MVHAVPWCTAGGDCQQSGGLGFNLVACDHGGKRRVGDAAWVCAAPVKPVLIYP